MLENETKIIGAAKEGRAARFGDNCPLEANSGVSVSANFIRDVLLGRYGDLHAHGLTVVGAYIQGSLDLECVNVINNVSLIGCRFDSPILLRNATFAFDLVLNDSCFAAGADHGVGVSAFNIKLKGSLHLDRVHSAASIFLQAAKIDGYLTCRHAKIGDNNLEAINGNGLTIGAGVSLEKSTFFGLVSFIDAKIGQYMSCNDASFSECECGGALVLDGSEIGGVVSLQKAAIKGCASLVGAQIHGELNLADAALYNTGKVALRADRVLIEGDTVLSTLTVEGGMRFVMSRMAGNLYGVSANIKNSSDAAMAVDGSEIKGAVLLEELSCQGAVRFLGARVGDGLSLRACNISATNDCAISFERATIGGDVSLEAGCIAGEVRLIGAKVTGNFDCERGCFDADQDDSVVGDAADIGGSIYLNKVSAAKRFRFSNANIGGSVVAREATIGGGVYISRAHIFENIIFDGAKLGAGANAFFGEGASIDGGVSFRGVVSVGVCCFLGAKVGGDLIFDGAKLENQDGSAFLAPKIIIGGTFSLCNVVSRGRISLLAAHVGDSLECNRSNFDGLDDCAVAADRMVVAGSIFIKNTLIRREVRFLGARVRGQVLCDGSVFDGGGGNAFSADDSDIDGCTFLCNSLFKGMVIFDGANCRRDLSCVGSLFDRCEQKFSLSLKGASVGAALRLGKQRVRLSAVCLLGATISELDDDESTWGDDVYLDGFRYSRIKNIKAIDRINWLDLQSQKMRGAKQQAGGDFRPQPWRELGAAFERMGHYDDARDVAVAFEDRLFKSGLVGTLPLKQSVTQRWVYAKTAKAAHVCSKWLVAYGYRPIYLIWWAIALWLAFGCIYYFNASSFVPSDLAVRSQYYDLLPRVVMIEASQGNKNGLRPGGVGSNSGGGDLIKIARCYSAVDWQRCVDISGRYPVFSALIYSFDDFVPFVELGERGSWAPLGSEALQAAAWFERIVGWFISLVMVAAVSGLVKRKS